MNAKYFTAVSCEICLQFEFEKFSIALRSGMSGKTLGFQSKKYFNPKISALKMSKYFIYKFATSLTAKYFTAMGCEICLQFEFEKFSIALRSGSRIVGVNCWCNRWGALSLSLSLVDLLPWGVGRSLTARSWILWTLHWHNFHSRR